MIRKGWLLFFIGFLLLVSMGAFFIFREENSICNDGTLYGSCSEIQPYFCLDGILIKKASFCGCSNLAEIEGDECVSEYQTSPKNITLGYTLNGKKGAINFTVYKGLYNYVSEIPRYINSTYNETQPTLLDFKLRSIDESIQREFLLPLIVEIQNLEKNKDDQVRIAVSIIQNIPFGDSNKTFKIGNFEIDYYRYPYEVLYEYEGVCGEKSELLVFLLRELGYGSAFLYYYSENHEAIGIKCLKEKSLNNTGYCFIETTGPSIITDYKTDYVTVGQLTSTPQITPISGELIFGEKGFCEYSDAKDLIDIRETVKEYGTLNFIQYFKYKSLKKKYGLVSFNNSYTF